MNESRGDRFFIPDRIGNKSMIYSNPLGSISILEDPFFFIGLYFSRGRNLR
jgi:hypothetical protein